jgi:hypothetical protein
LGRPAHPSGRQAHGGDFFLRKFTKHAPNPPFIDGSQMVDQREGLSGEAALAWRERRIEESLARSPSYRHYTHQRKALVTDNIGIAYHNAGPYPLLFVTDCGVEFRNDNRAATEFH